jgi:hypothetical protein
VKKEAAVNLDRIEELRQELDEALRGSLGPGWNKAPHAARMKAANRFLRRRIRAEREAEREAEDESLKSSDPLAWALSRNARSLRRQWP